MSTYSYVTEQDLINLRKLAEQQKAKQNFKTNSRYKISRKSFTNY